jgi:hypothetical protein
LERRLVKLAFIVVTALLFLQIPLRHVYNVEPYPAILLPSGAHVLKDTGSISFTEKKIVAVTASEQRLDVDTDDLLSTLPVAYRSYVIDRGFGFIPTAKGPKQQPSELVARQGRVWLENRLRRILGGVEFAKLEIIEYRVVKPTTSLASGTEMKFLRSSEIDLN